MNSHELAYKLLEMPKMDILIPMPGIVPDMVQPLEGYIIGKTGIVGDSQNPYCEQIILKGSKKT